MKHPVPNAAGTSAAHWQAARNGRLALPYCESCRRFHWPARACCPQCRGQPIWHDASGLGRIAAFSIVRRAPNPDLVPYAPYAVAFVNLDDGVRLFGNVVDLEPEALRIGLRVRCKFESACDGAMAVPVFVPEADSAPPPAPTQESACISGHTAAPSAPGEGEGAGGEGKDATPCLQDPSHAEPP